MSEPKDRSGAEPGKTFDEAWEALPTASVEPPEGGTLAWTEEVRAQRKREAPPVSDADEMDRLMRAEPIEPPPDEELPPSASTSAMSFESLDLPAGKPDESLMDALMGAVDLSSGDGEAEDGEGEGEAEEDDEELPPPIVLRPERQRERGPQPRPQPQPQPQPRARPTKSRVPLLVGGTVAAALAVWFAREPVKPTKGRDAKSLGAVTKPGELEPAQPVPPPSPPEVPDTEESEPPVPKVERDRSPPKIDPHRDPREPPEGTPEEIAAVFRKLPISPADRAPVGGIGKTGIHVDDVTMGNTYDQSRCEGGEGTFSVSRGDLANVCLRFVHQREKEEVSVVWQKVGGNARRGKIVVKPLHAYRTRAYLKLRSEYVGEWEVTILSEDGVALARYPFTVVP